MEDGKMIELPSETVYDSTSIEDIIAYRHWHAQSELYAGGDSLTTALYLGWTTGDTVHLEDHWLAGTRRVSVYYFELTRGDVSMMMPVIGNPYVDRLIVQMELEIVPVKKQMRQLDDVDANARIQ